MCLLLPIEATVCNSIRASRSVVLNSYPKGPQQQYVCRFRSCCISLIIFCFATMHACLRIKQPDRP